MEEVWKPINGYEGQYEISSHGRVKSVKRLISHKRGHICVPERILVGYKTPDGYQRVYLSSNRTQRKFLVHRLVAEAFIPNPNNLPLINHRDENKQNNRVDNLEWCTNEYNVNFGTRNKRIGESNTNSKYFSKSIMQLSLRNRIINTYPSISEAARQTGVGRTGIIGALKGRYQTSGGYKWSYQ